MMEFGALCVSQSGANSRIVTGPTLRSLTMAGMNSDFRFDHPGGHPYTPVATPIELNCSSSHRLLLLERRQCL